MNLSAAVTYIQVGAVVLALVGLAFFVLFSGYYFRNRRIAMQLRRTAREVHGLGASGPTREGDDGTAGPRTS